MEVKTEKEPRNAQPSYILILNVLTELKNQSNRSSIATTSNG